MTEVITIRKELAERLTRLPVETHESVTALKALRRTMERQRHLERKANNIEPVLVVGELAWSCSEGSSYYVKCKHDLPVEVIDTEYDVMTVAQHQRIMSALNEQYTASNQDARSNLSRQRMVNRLSEQLIENHPYEMEGIDFDYETSLHDKITNLLTERDNLRTLLEEVRDDSGFANLFEPLQEKITAAV